MLPLCGEAAPSGASTPQVGPAPVCLLHRFHDFRYFVAIVGCGWSQPLANRRMGIMYRSYAGGDIARPCMALLLGTLYPGCQLFATASCIVDGTALPGLAHRWQLLDSTCREPYLLVTQQHGFNRRCSRELADTSCGRSDELVF